MQLDVVLSSLLEHTHVSSILDFRFHDDKNSKLALQIVSLLLKNIHFFTVSLCFVKEILKIVKKKVMLN